MVFAEHPCFPFNRIRSTWNVRSSGQSFPPLGYGVALQAIALTQQGLVIRNGDQRVLIPREDIRHFQEQLTCLMADNSAVVEPTNVAHGV